MITITSSNQPLTILVVIYNQDEWLREIEEHERKSDMSEKQSVEMSSLKPF